MDRCSEWVRDTPSLIPTAVCSSGAHGGSYAGDAGVVQSLQRQIKEREQRIAELESQLDVLKAIDQDMEKRRKPSWPPATLMPAE